MGTRIPIFSEKEFLRLLTQAVQRAREETDRMRKIETGLRAMTQRWDHVLSDRQPLEQDGAQNLSPGRVFLSRLSNWTR
jgi:hypothetical protein